MRRASTDVTSPRSGRALVVFVRVGSDKDRFAYAPVALADDKGHFVASLGLNEHVTSGAAMVGFQIGEGIAGEFGGTRRASLAARFGNDAASIQKMVKDTEAREIDPENARAFD